MRLKTKLTAGWIPIIDLHLTRGHKHKHSQQITMVACVWLSHSWFELITTAFKDDWLIDSIRHAETQQCWEWQQQETAIVISHFLRCCSTIYVTELNSLGCPLRAAIVFYKLRFEKNLRCVCESTINTKRKDWVTLLKTINYVSIEPELAT